MKLDTKLVRIKVQHQRPDGKWKTIKINRASISFNAETEAEMIEGLARVLWKFLITTEDDAKRTEAYRHANRDTQFRVVKTTVYQDTESAFPGYEGREIHTNEVLCEPRSFNEHQEMRTYL